MLKTFRGKLILCFLLCTAIPLILIGMVSYRIATDIAEDKIIESVMMSGRQAGVSIGERLSQIENVADSVHFYLYSLEQADKQPLSKYLEVYDLVRNNIVSLSNVFDIYHISVFLKPESIVSQEGIWFNSFSKLPAYGIDPGEISGLGASPKWIYKEQAGFPYLVTRGEEPEGVLACYRSLGNTPKTLSYAYGIYITSEELSKVLDLPFEGTRIRAFLFDQKGLVAAGREGERGRVLPQKQLETYISRADGEAYEYGTDLVIVNQVAKDWYIAAEIPGAYITENTRPLVSIILLTLAILVPATFLVILFVSRGLTHKIDRLSAVMEQTNVIGHSLVAKELKGLIPAGKKNCDEIDRLVLTYDRMLKTLDQNFQDILDLSVQEERLKYQLLQSQINPHFLYNILNSIHTCQSIGRLHTAGQMLSNLSKFYRHILHKPDEMITIKEELEIVDLYLNMESLCRDNGFDWELYLDEGIENFMICKFTLQPILENSIIHGLYEKQERMHISIRIMYEEDWIRIEIEDDGIGMEAVKVTKIRRVLQERAVDYEKHFGIGNVNSRLASAPQGHGQMEIESRRGSGTKVTIRIAQIL